MIFYAINVCNAILIQYNDGESEMMTLTQQEFTHQLLKLTQSLDINLLMNAASYEPDASQKAVFEALYDYVLDTRQRTLIARKDRTAP